MSRFRRLVHSVASGSALLGVSAIYSLASLPLALHYLGKERFGLWALMLMLTGYLNLIDFGMSASIARLLVDHKDSKENGTYGSLLKTGWLVLGTQGAIILLLGFCFAAPLAWLLDIPHELQADFTVLLRWQCAVVALGFGLRIFNHLLYAHQRMDLTNYGQMAMYFLTFAALWFFFARGHGVFSLVWANLLNAVGNSILLLACCHGLKLFPLRGFWGVVDGRLFKEMFAFGKDLFLVGLGTQLILFSQTAIITRTLGLQVVTMWMIGTKMFTFVSQVIWRISDAAGPAFAEMMARGEHTKLRERYRSLVTMTASLAGFTGVSCWLCNSPFVALWMKGKIYWPPGHDALLGVWLIVLSILHCHNCFVLLTKNVGFMRYLYFVEGIVFVIATLVVARWGGLRAIIVSSVICSVTFSGAYGVWRISRYFGLPVHEIALTWSKPMGKVLLLFIPVALLAWWGSQPLTDGMRMLIGISLCSTAGLCLLLRYGITTAFQTELLQRAPKAVSPILRRVFVVSI
jgi:O-antigen/teichoic acid export membrane protein